MEVNEEEALEGGEVNESAVGEVTDYPAQPVSRANSVASSREISPAKAAPAAMPVLSAKASAPDKVDSSENGKLLYLRQEEIQILKVIFLSLLYIVKNYKR